jgi:choline-sulfatase
MARRPNILFLMADQMAAPALAMHGNKVARTPHIDALVGTGVVFDTAYCNCGKRPRYSGKSAS